VNRTTEHWFLDRQGKLLAWRDWRSQLLNMSPEDAYKEVAEWWGLVPMISRGIDPWNHDTWPTPWELVVRGQFCPSGQGLGMYYSLILAGFDCKLILAILNEETQPRLMVLLPNNKLLNYYHNHIVPLDEADIQLLNSWTPVDLPNLIKV
jgi:hypothetical protein